MQDMEFHHRGPQALHAADRNGKRTATAALKIACDLVDEGMISDKEAVAMIDPRTLDALLHPQFDAAALKKAAPVAKALAASPGAACGRVVFTAEDAKEWAAKGEKVVLVRLETSPEDIEGMKASQGILDRPRRYDLSCCCCGPWYGYLLRTGCSAINMDEENKKFELAGKTYVEGDYISSTAPPAISTTASSPPWTLPSAANSAV